jgi:Putative Ig domain
VYVTTTQTLIESWNGSTWSIVPSPDVSGTTEDTLNGVSCYSATACAAVGSSTSGFTTQPLFESWNGSTWTLDPTPPTGSGGLQGVSCSGPSACTAVGTVENLTFQTPNQLIETWDGTSFDVLGDINNLPIDPSSLSGVVCGLSQCFVVGGDAYFGTIQTLIEAWTGSAWTLVSSPTPPLSQSVGLSGVSCTSASACATVGSFETGSIDETLAESWDGSTWSIVPSPNPPAAQNAGLGGVSCTSPSACTAVGSYDTSTGTETLVETFDGTAWSIVPSPNADTPVTITTSSLPHGAVGSAYSATLAASGSLPPYVWTVVPGTKLPPGLRLSRAGVISGQPESAGTSTFKVRVSAAANFGVRRVAEATLSITVT